VPFFTKRQFAKLFEIEKSMILVDFARVHPYPSDETIPE
jgi:hypothetical protein